MTRDFFDPSPDDQQVMLVKDAILRQAEKLIESCEHCNPAGAEIPFDETHLAAWIRTISNQTTTTAMPVTSAILDLRRIRGKRCGGRCFTSRHGPERPVSTLQVTHRSGRMITRKDWNVQLV